MDEISTDLYFLIAPLMSFFGIRFWGLAHEKYFQLNLTTLFYERQTLTVSLLCLVCHCCIETLLIL